MQTVIRRVLLGALILTCSAPAFGLPREIVDQIKKVTAYVEVVDKKGKGSGTAFCIDAKGIFVTNEHVVHGGRKYTVILSPGEPEQRVVNAKVVKIDAEMDLALLQVDEPGDLKPLPLGDVKDLYDTMELTAFGYPFGTALAMKEGTFPNISVTTGHVTALRKKDGDLELIQLDAVLNPGNSGGPVIDGKGHVVGIAQSIIVATGINFAIPVSRLQKFLKDPTNNLKPEPELPTQDPTPPTDLTADPFHGKEWELTSYLKGTAPQIRDKLNGEVERLIARMGEAKDAIARSSKACVTDEEKALADARASSAYKQLTTEKNNAQIDLDRARKGGSSQDKLDASSRFNKARIALEKIEHDAVLNCEALSTDRHRMYDAQHDIKRYNEALDKAVAWREELLDATRNGFMLKGPAKDGAKGTLPRITVFKIEDGSHAIIDYDLLTFDFDRPGKEKEGIKSFSATKTRIKIAISGVNTSKMKQGDKLSIDHVYVLEGVRRTENQGRIYIGRPLPSDADLLFDTIVPLRGTLPEKRPKADSSN